ncbi:MAG TPA: hypothetical protein VNB22_08985 [Pyrinomonadaceae bacterium]|jgi:hypothetical protein|nr:hypothetical protein [Pyrinomonadaceae bacterium]
MNYFDANIRQHSGIENLPGCDFFAPPPMQIGQVITAQTSLLGGQDALPLGRRLLSVIFYSLIGLAIAAFIIYMFALTPKINAFYIVSIICLGLGVVVGTYRTSFYHQCSYVGENGVVEYFLKRNRNNQPSEKLFEFAKASAMYVEKTQKFTNGVYTGTDYKYRWVDQFDNELYVLSGFYQNKNAEPKDLSHQYYFATSAANSWNNYKLLRYIDAVNQGKMLIFNVKKMKFEMGLNMMNIYESGNKLSWNISDIESIQIAQGWVTIFNSNYQDIGWFSKLFGKGKITFLYSDMPNANLFLLLFESLYKKPIY